MKKRVLSMILSISMLVGALSGCGSESTSALEDYLQDIADVIDSDDEAEDVKDEDSEQEAEASEEETADEDDAVVVSDEAYIERLEAYQEYYNSIKDEDENYEVLAAISLYENNLPIMWIALTDKDMLERKQDGEYINYDCYIKVYGYEKEVVTLLAETSRYSSKYLWVGMLNDSLMLATDDSIYKYSKNNDKFEKVFEDEEGIDSEDAFGIQHYFEVIEEEGRIIYCGYEIDYEYFEEDDDEEDIEENIGRFWWDGSEVSDVDRDYFKRVSAWGGAIGSISCFLNSYDFDMIINDLKSEPIYDINMLLMKDYAIYAGWYDNIEYRVETLDEYLAE